MISFNIRTDAMILISFLLLTVSIIIIIFCHCFIMISDHQHVYTVFKMMQDDMSWYIAHTFS